MRFGQRNDDIVLGSCGLKLEVELAAEALAQRQSPRAIDAAAIGRMDDELHASRLVEKTLEHDGLLCRQAAQRTIPGPQVFHQLLGRSRNNAKLVHQPSQCGPARRVPLKLFRNIGSQSVSRFREFVGSSGSLAEPEWNGGSHAMRVLDADDPT